MRRSIAAAVILMLLPSLAGARAEGTADDVPPNVRAALGSTAEKRADGLYQITVPGGLSIPTHGPDPAPDPLHDHGTGMGPGDPERQPVCASDYHQHVLYGRLTSGVDRKAISMPRILSAMRRMNYVLNEESLESGNVTADYKVRCDGGGEIRVDHFTSPAPDFQTIVASARNAGFTASNADYSIFFDASGGAVCGVGSYYRDERASELNLNNNGGGYAVTYEPCWEGRTPMHENGHNQGAVQGGAPDSTGSGGHCNDIYDVLCYSPDGGDKNQGGNVLRCSDKMHFDCDHDTYFDSDPEPGEWLASNWNLGSRVNRFIIFGDQGGGGGGGNISPSASYTVSCSQLVCSFTDTSVDPDGTIASRAWTFGDGASSSSANPTHTYASTGRYTATLTVTDDLDASSSTSKVVVPPTTPVIGQPVQGASVEGPSIPVSGTGPPSATVTLRLDGAQAGSVIASLSGNWNTTITANPGAHSLTATASNAYGTSPASPARSFTVEELPPVEPVVTSPSAGSLIGPTPVVRGDARGAAHVRLKVNGTTIRTIPVSGQGTFEDVLVLSNGANSIVAEALGLTGALVGVSPSVTFEVDAIRPELRLDSSSTFLLRAVEITGTARDNRTLSRVEVSITDAMNRRLERWNASVGAAGSDGWRPWVFSTSSLLPGRYTVSVFAEDSVGLRSTVENRQIIVI